MMTEWHLDVKTSEDLLIAIRDFLSENANRISYEADLDILARVIRGRLTREGEES